MNDLAASATSNTLKWQGQPSTGFFTSDIESILGNIDVAEIPDGAFGMRTDQARGVPSLVGELYQDTGHRFAVELEREFDGIPGLGEFARSTTANAD